jgi:hypothetical protein
MKNTSKSNSLMNKKAKNTIQNEKKKKKIAPLGENILRCTTQDKKGLVLIAILFYLIF